MSWLEAETRDLAAGALERDDELAVTAAAVVAPAAVQRLCRRIKQQLGNHAFGVGVMTASWRRDRRGPYLRPHLLSTQSVFGGVLAMDLFRPRWPPLATLARLRERSASSAVDRFEYFDCLAACRAALADLTAELCRALALQPPTKPRRGYAGMAWQKPDASENTSVKDKPWTYGLDWDTPPAQLGVII